MRETLAGRARSQSLVRYLVAFALAHIAAGCGTPRDECVDPAVCDSVMSALALPDFTHRASRTFVHDGGEYHFVQVAMEEGTCCGGDDHVCAIWSPEGAASVFSATVTDRELAAELFGDSCPLGSSGGTQCDFPGYQSPLVQSLEFASWGSDTGSGFMGRCRSSIHRAQFFGHIPTPEDLEAP